MDNEEKIISMLEKQGSLIEQMRGDITEMKGDITGLKDDVTGLKSGQAKLEAEVARIRESVAVIEIDHGRSLRALHDGYNLLYDKLEPIPAAVETLQEDVAVIKLVVSSHSHSIQTLKAAN